MLTSDDVAQLQNDFADIRGDREESIVLRRDGSTLAAQDFRIERRGGQSRNLDGDSAEESRQAVMLVGATGADIQVGDRFNDSNGVLYEVSFVQPNRSVATIAEAEAIE